MKESTTELTAIIEQSEGRYVISCPELDLATEADTPDEALDDLIEMAIDYSEQYMDEFELFSKSPNRASHAPFVLAIRERGSKEKVKTLFT